MRHLWLVLLTGLVAVSAAAQMPPAGVARLEVTISKTNDGKKSSTLVSFLIPIDGKSHEFQKGRQMPVQTRVNFVVTTTYIDATTRTTVTLTPYRSGAVQYVEMAGAVQETHIVEQLGIPFALTDEALLDTSRCMGRWLMTNGDPREICSWSRRGAQSSEWKAVARLLWQEEGFTGASLAPEETSTTEATSIVATPTSERLQSISCDSFSKAELTCESQHGKQIPVVTVDGATRITTYIDATTRIELEIDSQGTSRLEMMDTALEPPPSVQQIDFRVLGTTRSLYAVPVETVAIDDLVVSRMDKTGEGEVSVTLQRFRRMTPAVAAQ